MKGPVKEETIRAAVRWTAWGVLVIAAAVWLTEYILSGYVRPEISNVKWGVLPLAVLALVLAHRKRPNVSEMHLPH